MSHSSFQSCGIDLDLALAGALAEVALAKAALAKAALLEAALAKALPWQAKALPWQVSAAVHWNVAQL